MLGEHAEFRYYPSADDVDRWLDVILKEAAGIECTVEILDNNGFHPHLGPFQMRGSYVRFSPEGRDPFYGYWMPALSGSAPLLLHTPGYGAEMSIHPELVAAGYNVLHVTPLGYITPDGPDESKKRGGIWPVLPDTVLSGGGAGYREWLIDVVLAVRWAESLDTVIPGRVSFFGTSQGGGGSLLLGSLFKDRGVRCVASDLPFMINFPLAKELNERAGDGFNLHFDTIKSIDDPAKGWRGLGFIDILSHARRLDIPVLLTAGGNDPLCRPEGIFSLFDRLPSTKLYCFLEGHPHTYSMQFSELAASWFRLYA